MDTTVLHTAEAAEDTLTVAETMETLEAWVKEWVTKTEAAQAEAAELEVTGNMEQQAEAAEQKALDKMLRIQHRQTELEALDMLEDSGLDQEHQVVELDQTTAGLLGLVSEEQAVMAYTELQAEAAEAAELEAEDLAEVEQEAHKQLITLAEQEEMEQVQAAAVITINQESVIREVLA